MATNTLAVAALTVKLVLPAFSDFAEKAQLDLPLPITKARVTEFHIGKFSPSVMVVIDGRHQFNWQSWENNKDLGMKAQLLMGSINYYDNSNALSRMAGKLEQLVPLSGKQSLITGEEACEIALSFLKRVGYDLRKSKAKVDLPRVRQFRYRPDDPLQTPVVLPGYNVEFIRKGVKKPEWSDELMAIEVSGLTKKITRFTSSPEMFKAVSVDLRNYSAE